MVTKIKSDKIIAPDGICDGFIRVCDGKIEQITNKDFAADTSYDFTGLYVSPGFIEMHTHGGGGYSFADSSPEDVKGGCDFALSRGVTSVLPTISAAPIENMRSAVKNIAYVIKNKTTAVNVIGAHLEGPYLSEEACGAQCPRFITPPCESEYIPLVEELGEFIARWTYAPEHDGGGKFARYLTLNGILPSVGHSAATYADMLTAIENGCKLVTHLYSCTSTVTRRNGFRSLGIIETAFLRDDLFAEIIADGKHLPPELINMIVKIKGENRVALITDSLAVTGTRQREGVMSGTPFIIEDGVCKLRDRSAFAGSIATADTLIRTITDSCGLPLISAVKMLTQTPAAVLGLAHKGRIERGCDADLTVFDGRITPKSVFVGGKCVYGTQVKIK